MAQYVSPVVISALDGEFLQFTAVNNSAGGNIAAPAGISGAIIRIYKLYLVFSGNTNITFQDGSTALSGPMAMLANGSITLSMDGTPWFTTSVGNAFNINSSASVQVSGAVYFTQLPTLNAFSGI